jgi:hypothetical protein
MTEEKIYYLVNPSGTIHIVNQEHARMRLKQIGYRLATGAEAEKYEKIKAEAVRTKKPFTQDWEDPICKPWSPEPDMEPELPEPVKKEPPQKGE